MPHHRCKRLTTPTLLFICTKILCRLLHNVEIANTIKDYFRYKWVVNGVSPGGWGLQISSWLSSIRQICEIASRSSQTSAELLALNMLLTAKVSISWVGVHVSYLIGGVFMVTVD